VFARKGEKRRDDQQGAENHPGQWCETLAWQRGERQFRFLVSPEVTEARGGC
jgi:hypothetical protein